VNPSRDKNSRSFLLFFREPVSGKGMNRLRRKKKGFCVLVLFVITVRKKWTAMNCNSLYFLSWIRRAMGKNARTNLTLRSKYKLMPVLPHLLRSLVCLNACHLWQHVLSMPVCNLLCFLRQLEIFGTQMY
jgi:hypothetical protein